jgi:glucosamine kinase
MILIADSGSTKTSWRYIDAAQQIYQAKTVGFNPYFETAPGIAATIQQTLLPQLSKLTEFSGVSQIFYYGTGCGQPETCQIIHTALAICFPNATIFVAEDMLAAARGLAGKEVGIVCILGTGSNSCLYDGEKIIQTVGGLGIMLGDEGSGAYLGKQLLKDYLNDEMPQLIRNRFDKRFKTTKAEILTHIYSKPYPNRYMATFAKFLFDNKSEYYCSQLTHDCFIDFFDKTIAKYMMGISQHPHDKIPNYKVHFTGSIAFYFSDYILRIAKERKIMIGNIAEEPIAGLALFHTPMS